MKAPKKDTKGRKKVAADKTTDVDPSDIPGTSSTGNSNDAAKVKLKIEPLKKLTYFHILAVQNLHKILNKLYR